MKKSNKNHLPHKNAPKNSIKKAKEIVRKVTRKGKRATYTLEDLQKAVDDVKSGKVGVRDAAEMYGIPRSTITANFACNAEVTFMPPYTVSLNDKSKFKR